MGSPALGVSPGAGDAPRGRGTGNRIVATMQDVATLAGVSAKTVSRVHNGDPHVLPETRERVERAMRELNYVPNVLARTFRDGRSRTIGVAVPDVVDPFFAAVVRAVEAVCARAGLTTLVTSIGDDPERERPVLESLLRTQLMGLVLAPVAADQAWLAGWTEHTPIVAVDRIPGGLEVDRLVEDDREGARLATRHLIEHGHRAVAFLADGLHPPSTQRRLEGWRAALEESGIAPRDEWISTAARDRATAAEVVATVARGTEAPSAVFSSNARVTMAAFEALAASGLAFAGLGDFPMADRLSPAVTVIEQDPETLGRLAAERALERFRDPAAPITVDAPLAVRLVERASCAR